MNTVYVLLLFGGLSVGLLGVCVGIFLLYKKYQGSSEVKLAKFGEIKTTETGAVLVFLGLFLFAFSAYTYSQEKRAENLSSRLTLLLTTTAKELRTEFHNVIDVQNVPIPAAAFDRVNSLVGVLRHIDPENGHVFYFTAEIGLWEGRTLKDVRPEFYRYLEVQDSLPDGEKAGDTGWQIVYERPKGYGRQRSGWIHNLMANDFFSEALAEKDKDKKRVLLEEAANHVKSSLRDYPKGFNDTEYPRKMVPSRLIIETKTLDKKIDTELGSLIAMK